MGVAARVCGVLSAVCVWRCRLVLWVSDDGGHEVGVEAAVDAAAAPSGCALDPVADDGGLGHVGAEVDAVFAGLGELCPRA